MGRASREKGKRGEREVAHAFTDAGIPMKRHGDGTGGEGQVLGDLDGLPDLYLEIRFRETLNIPAWLREVEEEAPEGFMRALVFRRSREPWHVAIPLEQYIELLKRREDG